MIARAGRVVYASPAQTHYFNCPLQLAMVPKHLLARGGGAPLSDMPADAAATAHALRAGDVVVFATDGVWDNLTNQDILRAVTGEMRAAGAWRVADAGMATDPPMLARAVGAGIAAAVARAVVAKAKAASTNDKVDGPFAKEVQKQYPGEIYHGGKVDDICVVSCVVTELASTLEESAKAKL